MSIRVDTTSLITGAVVVGDPGLGVLAETIPSTGDEDRPSFLYNDLSLPADNGKEIRGLITTWPTLGTLGAYEDGSFVYEGASDSFAYQLYVDGAAVGSPTTVTVTIGASSVTLAIADALHGHTADALALSTNTVLAIADALHAHLADSITLTPSGSVTLTIADALHAHIADGVTLTAHVSLQIADALHAHFADNVVFPSDLTDAEKIDLILDILSNRQTLNPATGVFTLYADDGVTVLKTAQAWEDAAGTIPYRGQALRRLDALQ